MFRNLTVGKKITFGYVFILILLTVVGMVSYNAINQGSEGFTRYRQIARNNNLAGRIQSDMLMVRMNVKNYIISSSEKDIIGFQDHMEKVRGYIEEAKIQIQNPERKKKINDT